MKKDTLERYARCSDGRITIDIAVDGVEDIFNEFERGAPYTRRDLDPDLADYLIECAREIAREPYLICFTFLRPPDARQTRRIEHGIAVYFRYMADVERRGIARMLRKSLLLFGLGLTILFLAVWVNQTLGAERSVVADVFGEGLTVAAWVSLWEALATFLIEWPPHRRDVLMYEGLAQAPIVLAVEPPPAAEARDTDPAVSR